MTPSEQSEYRLVQIRRRRLSVTKLPRGEEPVYETVLDDNQEIIGVVFEWEHDSVGRKTVDHHLTVMVATRL